MIKVAVLDDYQNIFEEIINTEEHKSQIEFKVFTEPFENETETKVLLEDFDALFIMRERTPITNSLINSLSKLKFIMTSGMRNNSIDLKAAKKKNIKVCGTDINPNPAAEITWALIHGLMRNMKVEIDNMFQGYWQSTIGAELKGKRITSFAGYVHEQQLSKIKLKAQ